MIEWTLSYLRGAYVYKKIKGILFELFDDLDKNDVKTWNFEGLFFFFFLILFPQTVQVLNLSD